MRSNGVLITHPAKEFITPANLLNWEPDQAKGTLPVPYTFDLEHSTQPPFSGIASLLPSTTAKSDERLVDKLLLSS
jgi:hypothetical protein